ncbi:hypothetical protein D3C76_1553310 [compost metagenome]
MRQTLDVVVARTHLEQAADIAPVPMVVVDLVLPFKESNGTGYRVTAFVGTLPTVPRSKLLHRFIGHFVRKVGECPLAGEAYE